MIGAAVSGAIGYAVMDLMPWSMLGEVVDEDDLETGERREGTYYGLFMFVRKLAGSLAVWLALTLLGVLGYEHDQPAERGHAHRDALAHLGRARGVPRARGVARARLPAHARAARGDPRRARAARRRSALGAERGAQRLVGERAHAAGACRA